jgi:hypothetical protein
MMCATKLSMFDDLFEQAVTLVTRSILIVVE